MYTIIIPLPSHYFIRVLYNLIPALPSESPVFHAKYSNEWYIITVSFQPVVLVMLALGDYILSLIFVIPHSFISFSIVYLE